MKANRLWIIPVALAAGCMPMAPAPHNIEARAAREEASAEPPLVEEEVSARVTHRRPVLPESPQSREVALGGTGEMALSRIATRLAYEYLERPYPESSGPSNQPTLFEE